MTSGLEMEADGKYVQRIIDEMGLEAVSKGSDTPLPKEFGAGEGDQALEDWQAKACRRIAALVNYVALDRVDLQFTAGVVRRSGVGPTSRRSQGTC